MKKPHLPPLVPPSALATIAVLAFACFSLAAVKAAENDPTFSCVSWGKLPYTDIYFSNGGEMERIEMTPGRRSELYSMQRSETFAVYIKKDKPNGKPGWQLVGKTTFPQNAKRMLFLIAKGAPKGNKKEGLPLSVLGIEDSLDTFPAGTFCFANFTRTVLNVSFGDVSERLSPREIRVFNAKMADKGGLMSLVIRDKKGTPVFARRLFGQPRSRELVFIVSPKKAEGKLKTIIIAEIVNVTPANN
ncbi:MAG: hypothetical protein H7A51_18290 [Akkermansiaceae bacterium]|nr:hypothetical protein [Akkermansiaceae bacterium]